MASPYARSALEPVSQAHLDAFHVVKSIVRELMVTTRLVIRPIPGGAGVIFMDNSRGALCRLSLAQDPGFLEVADRGEPQRHEIRRVEDLYAHAERLRRAAWATAGGRGVTARPAGDWGGRERHDRRVA